MLSHPCFWQNFPQQETIFCEATVCGLIAQPANAWTNVGYLIVALSVLRDRRGVRPDVRKFFATSMLVLFIYSFAFHATGTIWGKVADVTAMFYFSAGYLTLALQRLRGWDQKTATVFFLLNLLAAFLYLYTFLVGNLLFFAHLLLATGIELRLAQLARRWMTRALLFLLGAMLFWYLDVKKILCWPDNHVLSGHGVWHLAAAAAIWCLYRSYPLAAAHEERENHQS
jgi:hypothetical protein